MDIQAILLNQKQNIENIYVPKEFYFDETTGSLLMSLDSDYKGPQFQMNGPNLEVIYGT